MTDIVQKLTAAMRKADLDFETVGGSSRHFVKECLLPALESEGLAVVEAGTIVGLTSQRDDALAMAENNHRREVAAHKAGVEAEHRVNVLLAETYDYVGTNGLGDMGPRIRAHLDAAPAAVSAERGGRGRGQSLTDAMERVSAERDIVQARADAAESRAENDGIQLAYWMRAEAAATARAEKAEGALTKAIADAVDSSLLATALDRERIAAKRRESATLAAKVSWTAVAAKALARESELGLQAEALKERLKLAEAVVDVARRFVTPYDGLMVAALAAFDAVPGDVVTPADDVCVDNTCDDCGERCPGCGDEA